MQAEPPPRLVAALYRAAAFIPGVRIVPNTVDAAGRPGIGVTLSSRPGPGRPRPTRATRIDWIFDRQSYRFLG